MSATAQSGWTTVGHHRTVSLTVYLISVAILIAALTVALVADLAGGHNSTSRGIGGKPGTSVQQDHCDVRIVALPC